MAGATTTPRKANDLNGFWQLFDTTGGVRIVQVLNWRPIGKGALLGSIDVVLDVGHRRSMTITECSVLVASNGRIWVNLPARPYEDKETGRLARDPATGKIKYIAIAKWPDRETSDQFSKLVLK